LPHLRPIAPTLDDRVVANPIVRSKAVEGTKAIARYASSVESSKLLQSQPDLGRRVSPLSWTPRTRGDHNTATP